MLDFASSSQANVSRFGILFLTLLIIFLTYIQQEIVVDAFIAAGPISLILNLSTMALGYYSSKWFRLSPAQTSSVTIEVGLQNSTLSQLSWIVKIVRMERLENEVFTKI